MNVWNLSGGKDSTAMCLMALEKGERIDDIVFVDTGMEFAEMYEHLDKFESYTGRKITRLRGEKTFEYMMFDYLKTKGRHKGERGYGWPHATRRWCTSHLKLDVLDKYDKQFGESNVHHIAYGFDEYRRYKEKLHDPNFRYPLVEWKVTEAKALKYCYDKGFDWGGLYQQFSRVSCWCCPLQSNKDLFMLFTFHPEKWERLKEMDSKSVFPWPGSKTLSELETIFSTLRG